MRKISCILTAALLSLTLAGCSSSENYDSMSYVGTADDGMLNYSVESFVAPEEDMLQESDKLEQLTEEVDLSRKLVYTYDINAEASNVSEMRTRITNRVQELGGYISDDNFYESYDGRESWNAVIRIPTEHREELSDYISVDTRVTRSNISVDDVTLNYADNEARLNVEKAAYEEYERLLEYTTSAEELVMIRNEMYDIQANIDSYETTLRYLQNDIDYTKFNINIDETRLGINEERNLGSAFIIAWQDAIEELVNFFADVVVGIPGFIIGLIILIFYLVLITIAVKIIHFIWRKIKKKFNINWRYKSKYERAAEIFAKAYEQAHKSESKEDK